jgi:hypothetical protein
MPIGQYRYNPDRPVPAVAGLKKVDLNVLDQALLSVQDAQGIPLLKYDVRANELAPLNAYTLTGKDRISDKTLIQSRTAGTVIAADPLFNNRPTLNFGVGTGTNGAYSSDLRLESPLPPSFTGFVVLSIAAALKNTPTNARILSFMKGTTSVGYLLLQSTGNILFGNSVSPAQAATILAANVPAADTPFVITYSYSRATGKVRIYLNGVFAGEGTASVAFDTLDPALKIGIGGLAGQGTATGWLGRIPRPLTMTEGVQTDAQVAMTTAALKAYYGIA